MTLVVQPPQGGLIDAASAIQAAIDTVAESAIGKGEVVIPAGLYGYDKTLFMRSGVTLRGEGDATLLQPLPGLPAVLGEGIFTTIAAMSRFYFGATTQPSHIALKGKQEKYQGPHADVNIKDMRIIGTRQTLVGDGACCVELMDFTRADCDNLTVEKGYDAGIRIEGAGAVNPVWTNFDSYTGGFATRWKIQNSRMIDCKHGIEIGEQATYGWIHDNMLTSQIQHGIRLTGGYIIKIYNNHIAGTLNGSNAIQLSRSQDVDVYDNSIDPANGWATVEECVKFHEFRRGKIHDNRFFKGGIVTQSGITPTNVEIYQNAYHNETNRTPSAMVGYGGSSTSWVRERVPTNNQMTAYVSINAG